MFRILLTGMIACALGPANDSSNAADAFPLRPGAAWVYDGTVADGTPVRMEMTVIETIKRNGSVTAARLRGMPFGLMQYPEDAGEHLLIRAGARKFYLVEPPRSQEALARLKNPQDDLAGLLHESELLLDLPLFNGQRICETAQLTMESGHCWVVIAEPGPDYTLVWRGLTGHKTFRFTPGIGITAFSFEHGPSRAAAPVKLAGHRSGRN